jgi:dienelactone hydrolase
MSLPGASSTAVRWIEVCYRSLGAAVRLEPATRTPEVPMRMRLLPVSPLIAILIAVFAASAHAAVKSRVVEYEAGGVPLQGYLAWDDAAKGKRPGVIVVHEWWGHNAHARHSADKLASAGYVAFALDMYGKGKVTSHPDSAQAFVAEATKDADAIPTRFDAALALLKADPHVDVTRIGAIGYCFGGAVVLGMARAGEDLKAVGTFHGALATQHPAEPGKVKAKLLIQTGSADPMVTADAVAAFEKEMTAAGAKYRVITYPGAKHSFTNPNADKSGVPGLEYNATADQKSWAELLKFFKKEL